LDNDGFSKKFYNITAYARNKRYQTMATGTFTDSTERPVVRRQPVGPHKAAAWVDWDNDGPVLDLPFFGFSAYGPNGISTDHLVARAIRKCFRFPTGHPRHFCQPIPLARLSTTMTATGSTFNRSLPENRSSLRKPWQRSSSPSLGPTIPSTATIDFVRCQTDSLSNFSFYHQHQG